MYLLTVAVVTSCAVLVFGQYPPCFTTDGKRKECVPVAQCELLSILARKSDKSDPDLAVLRRSFCGWKEHEPTVCCPEIPKPVQRTNEPPGVCSTPDGKQGECISLLSCPYLSEMARTSVPDENVDYLKKSSICCPLPPLERLGEEDADEPVSCPDLMTAFPPARETRCCGETSGINSKIIRGNVTLIDEYPWAVLIEYKIIMSGQTAFQCGGALISGKYVLTAAHCITGRTLQTSIPTTVVLGEYDTNNDGQDCMTAPGGGTDCTDGEKRIRIEKTIPHPDYIKRESIRNDIGLIRMRERAPYTDFIRPVCLPSKDLTKPGNTPLHFSLNAVGWGATEKATSSNIKLDVSLPFVDREKCQSLIKSATGIKLPLWKGQLCAGGVKDADTCKGDSGGPLVYEDEVYGTFELVGLVSFGHRHCGKNNVPGIYTNVYEYLDWIKIILWHDKAVKLNVIYNI